IAAPRERVFQALTTPDGLAGWWTTQVRGEAAAVGDTIAFAFRGPFNPRMRIAALDPPAGVAWEGVGGHAAWGETAIRFALDATDGGTIVRFWHELGSGRGDDALAAANFNWGYYLDSLRLLCETGRGKPYRPGVAGARVGADRSAPAVAGA
ncbi:MAG TPA: SRPBCC domain-containing protein, partial [Thermomicrobiales bacterium]|nr:SRPBCC domain-containing protein [Thermomicrobiales bacterium]